LHRKVMSFLSPFPFFGANEKVRCFLALRQAKMWEADDHASERID
jgi:hypothetical protein